MNMLDYMAVLLTNFFPFQLVLACGLPILVAYEQFYKDRDTMGMRVFHPMVFGQNLVFMMGSICFTVWASVTLDLLILLPFYLFDKLVERIKLVY